MPSLFTGLPTFGFHPIAIFLFLPVLFEDLSLFVTKNIKVNIILRVTLKEKKQTTEIRKERVENRSETRQQYHIGQDNQIQDHTEVEKEAEKEIDTTAMTDTLTEETESEHLTNHHVIIIDTATNEKEETMIEKETEEDRIEAMNAKEDQKALHINTNITEKVDGEEESKKIEKTDLIGQLHQDRLTHQDENEDHHTKIHNLVIDQGRDHCRNHDQMKETSDTKDIIEQTKHQTEVN